LLLQPQGPLLAFGLVLQGVARSSMMTILILVLVEIKEIGSRNAGAAGGLFFSAAEIGGVSGPLTIGIIYDSTGGFSSGLTMMTVVCVVLLISMLALRPHLRVK